MSERLEWDFFDIFRAKKSAECSQTIPQPEVSSRGDWGPIIRDVLYTKHGCDGGGAKVDIPNAVVSYVHCHPGEQYLTFTTSGAFRSRLPHEFVIRLKWDTKDTGGHKKPASLWPNQVLSEFAEIEARTGKLFMPGDFLKNVPIEAPYRHFVFYPDKELTPVSAIGDEPLVFIQAIGVTDEQLTEFEQVAPRAPNHIIDSWSERDPLFLLDP